MVLSRLRFLSSLLIAILILPSPSAAFDTPLSDTAVREAYFLGQRHDGSLTRFFDKYTKHLPPPKTGPYVSSIAFFTPFALIAELSSRQASGYSAQQAQIDHRNNGESVRIVVQIQFLDSSGSNAQSGPIFRPSAFWKDIDVQVFSEDEQLKPSASSADPVYICSEDGGCILTGVTLSFNFAPDVFTADSARIRVSQPNTDPLTIDFDLSAFR